MGRCHWSIFDLLFPHQTNLNQRLWTKFSSNSKCKHLDHSEPKLKREHPDVILIFNCTAKGQQILLKILYKIWPFCWTQKKIRVFRVSLSFFERWNQNFNALSTLSCVSCSTILHSTYPSSLKHILLFKLHKWNLTSIWAKIWLLTLQNNTWFLFSFITKLAILSYFDCNNPTHFKYSVNILPWCST